MFSAKRALAMSGAVAVAAVGLIGTAGTVRAATVSPLGCTNVHYYSTWNSHRVFVAKPGEGYRFSGDAGMNLTLMVSAGTTVGSQFATTSGTTLGLNFEEVVLQASHDISNSIQSTATNSITVTGQYHVQYFATVYYGAWGYAYNWEAGYINSACKGIITARGTAESPASNPGFHHTGS
jgi:hypothetical protein